MAERTGKVVVFHPVNRQGEIKPDDGGPSALFYLPSVTNAEPLPKRGDTVTFDAPEVRKNKQGKPVQGNATSVTITVRGPELPPERPRPSPRDGGRGTRGSLGRGDRGRGDRGRRFEPRGDRSPGDRAPGDRRLSDRRGERPGEGPRGERRGAPYSDRRGAPPSDRGGPRSDRRGRPERSARPGGERRPGERTERGRRPERGGKARESNPRRDSSARERVSGTLPLPIRFPRAALTAREVQPTLALEKLVLWPAEDRAKKPAESEQQTAPRFSQRNKSYFFQELFLKSFEHVQRHRIAWPALSARWNTALTLLEEDGWTVRRQAFRMRSRLSVGADRGGVLAGGGIALSRTLGFPIVPGSAIKGALRRAAQLNPNLIEADMCRRIFGEQGRGKGHGEVTFFDALPSRRITHLEIDAAYCHTPEYYLNGAPPADDSIPEAEYTLAIPGGSELLFALASDAADAEALVNAAYRLLEHTLGEHGLGARTSVGYGRFAPVTPPAV